MPCGEETICQITLCTLAHASWLGSSLPWEFACTEVSYSKEKVILHKQLQSVIHNVPECFLWRPFIFSHLVGYCLVEQKASPHHLAGGYKTDRDSLTPACTHPCTYSCTHIHTLIHMQTLLHIHAQSQADACTQMHTCVLSCAHRHTHIPMIFTLMCTHLHTHRYPQTFLHTHSCVHIHIHSLPHFFIFFASLSACRAQSQI